MTANYAAEVTSLYEAIQYRAPDSATLATYVALLTNGQTTLSAIQGNLEADPFTLNVVNVVIREYQAAFDRVPGQAGAAFWVGQVANDPAALANLNVTFANSPEFAALYGGANANTIGNSALISALYENVLGRAPASAGLSYWLAQGLTAAQLLNAFANSAEFIKDTAPAIIAFQNAEAAGTPVTTGSLFALSEPVGQTFTLTAGIDAPGTGAFASSGITGDGNLIYGTFGGVAGGTYSPGDQIAGAVGSHSNSLNLADNGSGGVGTVSGIPATVSNIELVNISSAESVDFEQGANFTGLTQLTINSESTTSATISVGSTVNVTVNDTGAHGEFTVVGGQNITVTEAGSADIVIGSELGVPSGAVNVTLTGPLNDSDVSVNGGTTVTVNSAQSGEVDIGGATGAVAVTFTGQGDSSVYVDGGTTVTVNSSQFGGYDGVDVEDASGAVAVNLTGGAGVGSGYTQVYVDNGTTVNITTNERGRITVDGGTVDGASIAPTGAVVVTDTALANSTRYGIEIDGGASATVNAAGDSVQIGTYDNSGLTPVIDSVTGAVVVNDLAAVAYDGVLGTDNFKVTDRGGTTVTVNTNTGGVEVGYASTTPLAGADPTGAVKITDTATGLATHHGHIEVNGGSSVNISAVAGSIYVGSDDHGNLAAPEAGAVTINEAGVNTGYQYDTNIVVGGGTTVTINTTGVGEGDKDASGIYVSGATGAVNITDTETGQFHDQIQVYGGTTVNITENATEQYNSDSYIQVGAGCDGEAFTTLAGLPSGQPTGNVVINDSTGSVYGGGSFQVYTNGATSVTVTGSSICADSYITDAQSQQTGGTSHLATVSITGMAETDLYIDANALTALSLTNSAGNYVEFDMAQPATPAAHALTLTLSNATDLTVEDDNGYYTSVTVNSSGTGTALNPDTIDGNMAGVVTATFNNSDALYVSSDSGLNGLTTITANGSGALTLEDASSLPSLTKIDASKSSGAVTVTINGDQTNFTGGSGANTVTLEVTTPISTLINGGTSGNNTLVLTNAEALYNFSLVNSAITNFQHLVLVGADGAPDGQAGADTLGGVWNVSGFQSVAVTGDPTALSLEGAAAGETLTFESSNQAATTWQLNTDTDLGAHPVANALNVTMTGGITDTLITSSGGVPGTSLGSIQSVTINSVGEGCNFLTLSDANLTNLGNLDHTAGTSTLTVTGTTMLQVTDTDASLVTLVDASSGNFSFADGSGLNLTSVTDSGTGSIPSIFDPEATGTLTLDSGVYTALTTITVTGSGNVDAFGGLEGFGDGSTDTSLTTVNGTGSSGLIAVDGVSSLTGVTFTGGSGLLIAVGSDNSASVGNVIDVFNVGSGGGEVVLGQGDAGYAAGTNSSVKGNETVNLTANAAGGTIIAANYDMDGSNSGDGSFAIVNNWNHGVIDSHQGADALVLGQSEQAFIGLGTTHGEEPVTASPDANIQAHVISNENSANSAAHVLHEQYGQYYIADGVLYVASTSPTVSGTQELADAESILDGTNGNVATTVGTLMEVQIQTQSGLATYVMENTGGGVQDTFVELNGVSGQTGFGVSVAALEGGLLLDSPLASLNIGAGNSVAIATGYIGELFKDVTLAGVDDAGLSGALNAAGYSAVNIAPTAATTISGLANFGIVYADTAGPVVTPTSVTVTQTGTDPVLVLATTPEGNGGSGDGADLASFTYGGGSVDTTLIAVSYAGGISVGTVTDASNTGTHIEIAAVDGNISFGSIVDTALTTVTILGGDDNVTLGAIADKALTTIDATYSSSNVTLGGDGLLTDPGALTQAGLHIIGGQEGGYLTAYASGAGDVIVGANGGDFIVANGAADHISVGSAAIEGEAHGEISITANGAADVISVFNIEYGATIAASGAGDTISVSDSGGGTFYITGNGDNPGDVFETPPAVGVTQLGANDTINVGSLAGPANAHAWVGANSVVNVAFGSADIHLLGDVAGANGAGLTTINGLTGEDTSLRLHFNEGSATVTTESWAGGSSHDSQVNVTSAATLAAALNLAVSQTAVQANQFDSGFGAGGPLPTDTAANISAHTGLVDWFQFKGNTYIVEANNVGATSAAHTTLGANDIVVELTGLVDVNHVSVAGLYHSA